MKKTLLSVFVTLIAGSGFAQCTIDATNTAFFSPAPDSIPCVERTVAYNQVIQISVPANVNLQDFGIPFPAVLNVDSLVVNDITGFPTGIDYQSNPTSGVYYGGDNGCFLISGTTSDPTGNYPLNLVGTISLSGAPITIPGVGTLFDGDTTIDLTTLQSLSAQYSLSLDVINSGDPCRSTSINDISFNASIGTYPNPAKDHITLRVNTAERINGSVEIINTLGAVVTKKEIDIIGTQTIDIQTANMPAGVYSLLMKDGKRKYSTTFIKE